MFAPSLLPCRSELVALDKSGYSSTTVTLDVYADYRNLSMSTFWQTMSEENNLYTLVRPTDDPTSLPSAGTWEDLPTSFSWDVFVDDPFRSLGSFVRDVENSTCKDVYDVDDDQCMRCFVRECDKDGNGIPFFEFRWGYFFNRAVKEANLWPSDKSMKTFLNDFDDLNLEYKKLDTSFKFSDWEAAADSLIELCRYAKTSAFKLPDELFSGGGPLPGAVIGWQPIEEKDPECGVGR